jgi:hypothetical protein
MSMPHGHKGQELDALRRSNPNKLFEVHVDSNFAGDWFKDEVMDDPSAAKSRTGCIINCGGCPVLWALKLQTKVALSTTESQHVGLSESLQIGIVVKLYVCFNTTMTIDVYEGQFSFRYCEHKIG